MRQATEKKGRDRQKPTSNPDRFPSSLPLATLSTVDVVCLLLDRVEEWDEVMRAGAKERVVERVVWRVTAVVCDGEVHVIHH
jgi:hypothetical protein